jgi:galactokinase/mevalonate kinase-like predicted kinase
MAPKRISRQRNEFRFQVGMTDAMSQAAGEFKFIIVEQYHFTKCVHFLSVKTTQAEEAVLLCFVGHVSCFRTSSVPKVVTAVNLLR